MSHLPASQKSCGRRSRATLRVSLRAERSLAEASEALPSPPRLRSRKTRDAEPREFGDACTGRSREAARNLLT